tara:strand:+ start:724 stop:924 length:201 start_codon:yes stop_codon:yes gene_type:complete
LIQIGYTTQSGEDTVTGSYDNPADANAAAEALQSELSSRTDIHFFFLQSDFGEGLNKYAFFDPLEA